MANGQSLLLRFLGDASSAKKAAAEVGAATDKTGKGIMGVGGKVAASLAIVGTAAVAFGVASVKAYAEAETSAVRLKAAVEATGKSYESMADTLDSTVKEAMRNSAYDDEDLADALATLTSNTGSAKTAMENLSLVTDVARGRKIDLAAAATLVAKIEGGNLGLMSRMGFVLDDNATSTGALALLQERYAGQAAAYASTMKGGFDAAQIGLDNIKESFGEGLTGDSAADLQELARNLNDFAGVAKVAGEGVSGIFDVLMTGASQASDALFWVEQTFTGWDTATKMMWDSWIDQGGEVTMTFQEFWDAVDAGTIKVDGLYVATGAAATATDDLGDDASTTAAEMDELTRAMNGTMVAADDLSGKERTLSELQNNASTASFAAKDALAAYNEAVADSGAESDAAQKAALRLQDAEWAAGDAAADLKIKEEELGTSLAGIATQKEYEAWLAGVRDRAREAAAQIGSMYDQSNRQFGNAGGAAGTPSGYKGLIKGAAGFVANEPTYSLLGEIGHREYAITTAPQYRPRAVKMYGDLGRDLGINGGGLTINLGGITASAQDAPFVEQAAFSGVNRALAAAGRPGF